ncbi:MULTISPECIES: primosomal protein N' (replication factor Y) - superfamily II helicase [Thioclava]|uniref:Primosomal protein N' (Replication factor Y) -superfamily II helicase n=1 Tax=Thioclava litoralis TaxID=3076557 RepID=A0ABZ1E393_9RHOB|nr:primosomal protein N' (replication factor Y) - superfamily II helicase [Thioclava sp. FTW29]
MKLPRVARPTADKPRAKPPQIYPCEACGADLRFNPGETRMVCDHCGHMQDIPAILHRGESGLRELPLAPVLANGLPETQSHESRHLSCPNCSAQIELGPDQHATECPFCATPIVTDAGDIRQFRPQGVLPFAVTETEARAALTKWLKGRWFAPNGLAEFARKGRKMTGVYAPFWTFDARTRTRYSGQRGDYYYETRLVTVNENGQTVRREQQERRIRWTPVAGQVGRDFDDVLVYAARSLPAPHVGKLMPWNLSHVAGYDASFLAGFSAENYTVEVPEAHHQAQAKMLQVIQSDIRRDIGGDTQRIAAMDPQFSDETFKHILLPIWSAAYRFQGKSYRFIVNGQTGCVSGDRPWSVWKIALAAVAVAVIAGLVLYFSR